MIGHGRQAILYNPIQVIWALRCNVEEQLKQEQGVKIQRRLAADFAIITHIKHQILMQNQPNEAFLYSVLAQLKQEIGAEDERWVKTDDAINTAAINPHSRRLLEGQFSKVRLVLLVELPFFVFSFLFAFAKTAA